MRSEIRAYNSRGAMCDTKRSRFTDRRILLPELILKMNKDEYISDMHVRKFVTWMSANLETNAFAHTYWIKQRRKFWSCSSLYDALEKYEWKFHEIARLSIPSGSSFKENTYALSKIKNLLALSLKNGDDFLALHAATAVMSWGGVPGGNANWLVRNQTGLADFLRGMQGVLNKFDTGQRLLDSNVRFNAGMTKIYSLICNNFVIYDSRVAATLGWGVVKYCKQNCLEEVPEELRFPHPPFRGNHKRDASVSKLKFPRLHSSLQYLQWNLKASWLLESVLKHENAKSSEFVKYENNALRALEAALFMIGYDLCRVKN